MNKTILIIDDDAILNSAISSGLKKEGFYTITSSSAEEASEILEKVIPDAIILDRMMTGMDGLTFLKKIRSEGILTPVIMLTAMTGPENAIDGLSEGADDYLGKPFQLKELVLRLQNILKKAAGNRLVPPQGLIYLDDEFFIKTKNNVTKLLSLSGEEKKLLQKLISPIGNIVAASPMVAKRLRTKINNVLSNIDIITVRGKGYRLIDTSN